MSNLVRHPAAILGFVLVTLASNAEAAEHLTSTYGTFYSPNYPNPYENNLNRKWDIEVRKGYRIKLKFNTFELEDSYEDETGPCAYDYVKVYEGTRAIGRFCGNYYHHPWDAPRPGKWYYSSNNSLTVQFVSDFSNEGKPPTGFSAHYVEIDINECAIQRRRMWYALQDWDKYVYCDHYCNNVPGNYYCSCRNGFSLHANNHTCVATFCENQVLQGKQGVIESPEFPQSYAKLTHCKWHISVRAGLSVNIAFGNLFEVETHPEAGCVYDILWVKYLDLEYSYCGTSAPNNGSLMETNTKEVTVEFTTDMTIEGKGFKLTYNTTRIKCLTMLTHPPNGRIVSELASGHYRFEDVVLFACNRGYDLVGSQRLECLSDGQWDHIQPTCKIKSCENDTQKLNIRHGSIANYSTASETYLEVLTVECDTGYEMTAGVKHWICEDDKQWLQNSTVIAPNEPKNLPVCKAVCGIKPRQGLLTRFIAGGKQVEEPGAWPWMAFVDLGQVGTEQSFCGGSLIDERTVVTAAHCLGSLDAWDPVIVWLGMNNRTNDEHAKAFRVDEWEIDETYTKNLRRFDFDIAVLKLNETVKLSKYITPICLPLNQAQKELPQRYFDQGEKAVVIGWGKTGKKATSEVLMKTRVNVANHTVCAKGYNDLFPNNPNLVTEDMICAGYHDGHRDACRGDSGGPLMFKDQNGRWILNGVVSFGDEREKGKYCGSAKTYGVYTKVGNYVEWIQNYMEQD